MMAKDVIQHGGLKRSSVTQLTRSASPTVVAHCSAEHLQSPNSTVQGTIPQSGPTNPTCHLGNHWSLLPASAHKLQSVSLIDHLFHLPDRNCASKMQAHFVLLLVMAAFGTLTESLCGIRHLVAPTATRKFYQPGLSRCIVTMPSWRRGFLFMT